MNKTAFLLIALAGLLLAACKNDSKNAGDAAASGEAPRASAEVLAGNWIASDFCNRARQYGSVLRAMNESHKPFAYAFSFDPARPDSILCNNGKEAFSLPISIRVDTIEIKNAVQGKPVYLTYDSQGDKSIAMFDNTSGRARMTVFTKSTAPVKDPYAAFEIALGFYLFDGLYTALKGNEATTGNVRFQPGGQLIGMKSYDYFKICTAGDCFLLGPNGFDIVTLSRYRVAGSEAPFAYRISAQRDTITFYNVIPPPPGESATFTPGKIAFQFLRKKDDKK